MRAYPERYYPDARWRRLGAVRLPPGALLLMLSALGAWAASSGLWVLSGASALALIGLQVVPWRHGLSRPVRLGLSLACWVALVLARFLLDPPPHTVMWLVSLVADVFALWLVLDLSRRMPRPELLLPYSCAVGLLVCAALNPEATSFAPFALGFVLGGLLESSGLGVALAARPARAACLAAALAGWWLLAQGMPEAQRWYRQNLGAWLATAGPVGSTGFGPDSRLGDLAELRLSARPVLRIAGPPPERLLGAVHTRYNDGRWDNRDLGRRKLLPHTRPETVPARFHPGPRPVYLLERNNQGGLFTVFLASPLDGVLFAPAGTVAVKTGLAKLEADGRGILYFEPQRMPETYEVLASGRSPGRPGPEDLLIPRRLQPALKSLLREVPGTDLDDPRRAAEALTTWLRLRCRYSLTALDVPGHEDPILHFLTSGRRGYCEHFAGALTLLMRARGFPARYAVGFAVSEEVPYGGYYLVRGRDAHAWVEIWTPEGWTVVDPSPPAELEALALRPPMGALAQRLDTFLLALDNWRAGLSLERALELAGGWKGGLAALAVLLVLLRLGRLGGRRLLHRWTALPWWRRDPSRQGTALDSALRLLDRSLAAAGRPRPPGCTLLELPALLGLPEATPLMVRICQARFAGVADPVAEGRLAGELEAFVQRELRPGVRRSGR